MKRKGQNSDQEDLSTSDGIQNVSNEPKPPTERGDAAHAKRMTMRDVAKEAGVSLGTVSRVLSGKGAVTAEARRRVLEAAGKLHYEPDVLAQSMRTHESRAIGVMVSNVSYSIFSSMVGAVESTLVEAGYITVLANTHYRPDKEVQVIDLFRRRRMDGLIGTISDEHDQRILAAISALHVPVVLMERETSLDVDSVVSDHYAACFGATRYLIDLGHKRIGLITVPDRTLPGRERRRGFSDALAGAGLAVNPDTIIGTGYSQEYGFRTAYSLLTMDKSPTALIVGGNQLPGILKAVRSLGLNIPGDVSIISIGDTDVASLYQPAITVVRVDHDAIGLSAANLLISRLTQKGPLKSRRLVLPSELVLRESCRGPPPNSP